MFGAIGDLEVGIDALCETRKNRADCNEEGKPRAPVPAAVIAVTTMRIVHSTNIEFLLSNKVEIGNENTGNWAHETCIPGKESEQLATVDDDRPCYLLASVRCGNLRLEAIQKIAMKRAARRILMKRGARAEISFPKGYEPAAI